MKAFIRVLGEASQGHVNFSFILMFVQLRRADPSDLQFALFDDLLYLEVYFKDNKSLNVENLMLLAKGEVFE